MGRRDEFHAARRKSRSVSDVQRGEQRATRVRRIIHDKRPITARSEPLKFLFFSAADAFVRFDCQERHAFIAFGFEKGSQEGRKIGTRRAQPDEQNGLGAVGKSPHERFAER